MAYTFGAGTGDDITWLTGTTAGANATAVITMGWWFPTTLTATRGLWSVGSTFGAEIDTTTSELRLRTDNTTDGQWTTTGAALATNKWSFLAFFGSFSNTGPAAAWRVWMGTQDAAPVALTVTQATAPVGNFTGNANMYLGNKGTGTLAFQGDVGRYGYYACNAGVGVLHPFAVAAYGTITDAEAEFAFQRFIQPFYRGLGFAHMGCCRANGTLTATTETMGEMALGSGPVVTYYNRSGGIPSFASPTINGATWSQNREPIPAREHLPYLPALVA